MWNSQKIKEYIKSYHKISKLRKFIKYKYSIRKLHFGTLVLAVHYHGDNVKYGKTTIWRLKKSQSDDKLLEKITSSTCHMG